MEKSYIACTFANLTKRKIFTAYFCAVNIILVMAEEMEREKLQLEFIDEMFSHDLLIIDDFCLISLDVEKSLYFIFR